MNVSNTPRGGQNAKRALRHKKYTQTFLGGGTTSIARLAALLADWSSGLTEKSALCATLLVRAPPTICVCPFVW